MAHSVSARKRIRQNARRHKQNKAVRSRVRTQMKKVLAAVAAKDEAKAKKELLLACSLLDKAAKRNVIHANTASRYKSRLTRRVNAVAIAKA